MPQPLILHIETSSKACSVALAGAGELIAEQTRTEQNIHSAALVPMINEILRAAETTIPDLAAIAVSIGPGSYTGLRVGLSTAKGLCYASGLPLIAVDTLASLAVTTMEQLRDKDSLIVAALDARRMDAYAAIYRSDGRCLAEPFFLTVTPHCLDAWREQYAGITVCGEGMYKWEEVFGEELKVRPLECRAPNLVSEAYRAYRESRFADLRACVPLYVKPPNITIQA